jgi:hypothetical protein
MGAAGAQRQRQDHAHLRGLHLPVAVPRRRGGSRPGGRSVGRPRVAQEHRHRQRRTGGPHPGPDKRTRRGPGGGHRSHRALVGPPQRARPREGARDAGAGRLHGPDRPKVRAAFVGREATGPNRPRAHARPFTPAARRAGGRTGSRRSRATRHAARAAQPRPAPGWDRRRHAPRRGDRAGNYSRAGLARAAVWSPRAMPAQP